MKKKSQITIFIIFGILLIAIFAFIFWINTMDNKLDRPHNNNIENVNGFITLCLKETATYALRKQSLQGGYLELPDKHFNKDFILTASLSDSLPTLQDMETDLAEFIDDNIDICLNDFSLLEDFNITTDSAPRAEVDFTKRDTVINLEYNIKVSTSTQTKILDRFVVKLPYTVAHAHSVAKNILETNPISMQMLVDAGYESHVIHYLEADIFLIIDFDPIRPYIFSFAAEK